MRNIKYFLSNFFSMPHDVMQKRRYVHGGDKRGLPLLYDLPTRLRVQWNNLWQCLCGRMCWNYRLYGW